MRTALFSLTATFALTASSVSGAWVYEGSWGKEGSGYGEFDNAYGIAVAANGNVYVADCFNERIQYFNATGSYLGEWWFPFGPNGISFGPQENLYVSHSDGVLVFTSKGSLITSWPCGRNAWALDVGPKGDVYVACTSADCIQRFTSDGSLISSWGQEGRGNGQFQAPWGVAVAPNGNVYVSDFNNVRVQYFTRTGSFLGKWATRTLGVAVAPDDGKVFVCYGAVRRFTPTGSLIETWYSDSRFGALSRTGTRLYVTGNNCVMYYRRVKPAVAPASLGRVKALFK